MRRRWYQRLAAAGNSKGVLGMDLNERNGFNTVRSWKNFITIGLPWLRVTADESRICGKLSNFVKFELDLS